MVVVWLKDYFCVQLQIMESIHVVKIQLDHLKKTKSKKNKT